MELIKLNIQYFSGGENGVDFSSMTQGVSQAGIQAIYEKINYLIVVEAVDQLNDRTNFEQVLRENWSGADCEVFIANMAKLANEIIEKLQEYDSAIKNEFRRIVEIWNEFQSENVITK